MSIDLEQQTRGNVLLSQLAVHERNAIHRASDAVSVEPGDSLLNAHTHSAFVFFPVTAVVSVVRTLRDGAAMELALIGSEGLVGVDAFFGSRTQLDDAVVQSPGWAYRMPADELQNQLRRGGGLQKALLRFMDSLYAQIAQTAICARFHAADARAARWLLMLDERMPGTAFRTTASALTGALSLDANVVASAVRRLASAGAISSRGDGITMSDRQTLEIWSCECYETLRQEYDGSLAS